MQKRRYRKSQPYPSMYLVVNKYDEVFAGLKGGSVTWSKDWDEGKPLFKDNTTKLVKEYNAELLEV